MILGNVVSDQHVRCPRPRSRLPAARATSRSPPPPAAGRWRCLRVGILRPLGRTGGPPREAPAAIPPARAAPSAAPAARETGRRRPRRGADRAYGSFATMRQAVTNGSITHASVSRQPPPAVRCRAPNAISRRSIAWTWARRSWRSGTQALVRAAERIARVIASSAPGMAATRPSRPARRRPPLRLRGFGAADRVGDPPHLAASSPPPRSSPRPPRFPRSTRPPGSGPGR